MKKLTIFTPTFNRAYCLGDLYESLCRQTNNDFEWLVIDDGSTDDTAKLVDQWKAEEKIAIRYIYKENGGMHTGYNTAYKNISTELNMCMDSDDYCTDDAVQNVIEMWEGKGSVKYAGIIGLDSIKGGGIIGDPFPDNLKDTTVSGMYQKHNIKGDKKLVYRTDVVKKYPQYPEFPDERFVPIFCIPYMIDQDFTMLTMNKVLCVVEYREDGSTKNILMSYFKNPKGFAYARKIRMKYSPTFADRFRNAMHYVSSSIITANRNFLQESPSKMLTLAAVPSGILLHMYLLFVTRDKR